MSSKLRKLKQQAYEAGKRRDWSAAADSYSQILEADKNNPSLLNEYGDMCLKAGDTSKAVRQFLSAAAKYKSTGLLNNAQAVYKKVLRHEANNINAHWFLAEIRASQGMVADGKNHALKFLAAAEEVSGEIKEIFLKRCHELLELYRISDEVLERVQGIFRLWDMPLEAARAGCLRACIQHGNGDEDGAAAEIQKLVTKIPELANYAEFVQWRRQTGETMSTAETVDVNSIELEVGPAPDVPPAPGLPGLQPRANSSDTDSGPDTGPDIGVEPTGVPASPASPASPPAPGFTGDVSPADGASDEASFADLNMGRQPNEESDNKLSVAREDDGSINIEIGSETDFTRLMDDLNDAVDAVDITESPSIGMLDDAEEADETINLLDDILAEEGHDIVRSSDSEQMSTIASEIGRNLGQGGDGDPEAQYQQGLVYLEMGLHDQAALAFEAASDTPERALQAREMWGIALQRDGQLAAALQVLEDGLETTHAEDLQALGLRYHAACILAELGREDEAQDLFRLVHALDAGFADVAQRLHTRVG